MAMLGMGQALPPGFVSRPFDCPAGSDYNASQEMGMCAAVDYSVVYSQSGAGAPRCFYNLDGSVAGCEEPGVSSSRPGCPKGTLIPCVPNLYLYVGAALFVLMYMLPVRRR